MIATRVANPALVITGASSGIGRELALAACSDVETLLLVARTIAPMQELAAEIEKRGRKALVLPLDITSPGAGEAIESFLHEHALYCDILVNNAGYGLLGPAASLGREEQLGIIDLNIRALSDLSLRFLPGMRARRRGGILNVASVASFMPGPNMAMYYASKAFVRSFSEALWDESKRANVTISCLCPGPVQTAFLARAGADSAPLFQSSGIMDAATCARIGWAGYKSGDRIVIPGVRNRMLTLALPFIPARAVLWAVRRLQKSRGKT